MEYEENDDRHPEPTTMSRSGGFEPALEWPPPDAGAVDVWDLDGEQLIAGSTILAHIHKGDIGEDGKPALPVPAPALVDPATALLRNAARRVAAGPTHRWRSVAMWVGAAAAAAGVVTVAARSGPRATPSPLPSAPILQAIALPAPMPARALERGTAMTPPPAEAVPPSQADDEGAKESNGRLVIREPAGARVSLDGKRRGSAPVTLSDVRPGDHEITVETRHGTIRQRVTIEAGSTLAVLVPLAAPAASAPAAASRAPRDEPAAPSGWISVPMPFQVQVLEEGRFVATNQTDRILMAAGSHRMELVNESLNFRAVYPVEVETGKVTTIAASVPTGTLSVNALPWSEVLVDGRSVGQTPLAAVTVPIGPHEIVFRHPELGEKRRSILVTSGTPIRVSVDFRK